MNIIKIGLNKWKAATIMVFLTTLGYSQNGNVMHFNGINNYVDLGNEVGNGTRTIEFWFRPLVDITPDLAEVKTLIARDGTPNNYDEFNICFSPFTWNGYGGRLRFTCTYSVNQTYSIYSDSSFWDSHQWYHIAAVIHPDQGLLLFINGQKQSSHDTSFTTAMAPNGYITTIGCWGDYYDRFYNGLLDELRFSDVARYETDFTPPCPEFDVDNNTRGLYHFNEKNGTMVSDYSNHAYNGDIYGSTYLAENICNTNSIQTLTTRNHTPVYPNPTESGFHIHRNAYEAREMNIEIYDTSMKTLLYLPLLNADFVDIGSLSPGLYVYIITDRNKGLLDKGTIIKE